MKSLEEIFGKAEDLHPELACFLTLSKGGGEFHIIQHPLVYSVPHIPELNSLLNKQLEHKKKSLVKALEQKDWISYIYLHERPHRIGAFLDIAKDLNNKEYWELASSVWIDSENIWQNKRLWKRILTSKRPEKHHFMSEEDNKSLKGFPDKITIYRGYRPGKNKHGFSYSLNKNVATKLGKRLWRHCSILERTVSKSEIFAYLGSRGEEEIIIL